MSAVSTQAQVRDWFDDVYRERGLDYLRPPEAYPIFLQFLGARPGERILDIACGPGLLLRAARERSLEATGIDLSRVALGMVDRVAPGAARLQANAERLPFANGAFDLVTCIGSLERFLDRDAALREMRRVVRPGARLCLMVRNARAFSWRRLQWFGAVNQRGHQDAATLEQWSALFDACGLRVRAVLPDQWFFQKWRNRIAPPRSGADEPVVTRMVPLAFANEFIFILEPVA